MKNHLWKNNFWKSHVFERKIIFLKKVILERLMFLKLQCGQVMFLKKFIWRIYRESMKKFICRSYRESRTYSCFWKNHILKQYNFWKSPCALAPCFTIFERTCQRCVLWFARYLLHVMISGFDVMCLAPTRPALWFPNGLVNVMCYDLVGGWRNLKCFFNFWLPW
jgi:hypothetical protein